MPVRHECFSHDADIGVRGYGETLEQAFEQAAIALTSVITDPEKVASSEGPFPVSLEAPDLEFLLADWLNAVIYEMAVRRMLFGRFQIHINDCRLTASLWGEPLDRSRHQPAVEIKGATYTGLEVKRHTSGFWVASCIVDV